MRSEGTMKTASRLLQLEVRIGALERVALLPKFDEWVAKKRFKNPATGRDVGFSRLEEIAPDKAKKIRKEFDEKVKKWQSSDKAEPLKQKFMETQQNYQRRLRRNEREMDAWRAEELDKILSPKLYKAIEKDLEEAFEKEDLEQAKEFLEPLKAGVAISELDDDETKFLKNALSKVVKKQDPKAARDYVALFGLDQPADNVKNRVKELHEVEDRFLELMENEEGNEEELNDLIDEMRDLEEGINDRVEFIRDNPTLCMLHAQIAALDAGQKPVYQRKGEWYAKDPKTGEEKGPFDTEQEAQKALKPVKTKAKPKTKKPKQKAASDWAAFFMDSV